ncbi:MAG: RCC1 domain-containing protein [Endomicrobiia bacterium]
MKKPFVTLFIGISIFQTCFADIHFGIISAIKQKVKLLTSETGNITDGTVLGSWTRVSCGSGHTIAIKEDGTLWAWGHNLHGELGLGDTTDRSSPTRVGLDSDWSYVFGGEDYTAAIKKDGTMWSWGLNSFGQLGHGDWIGKDSPTRVGLDSDWSYVSCGDVHTVAIKKDGTLWAWGSNFFGQLGLGDKTDKWLPTKITK